MERMFNGRSRRQLKSEINMTPLVDVMLVLLVIFMISAPMMTTGVPVNLPKVVTQNLPVEGEPLSLSLDEHGEVFLQGSPLALEEIPGKIQEILKENPQVRIQMRADKALSYGAVMSVMSLISRSGCHKIALVTDPSLSLEKGLEKRALSDGKEAKDQALGEKSLSADQGHKNIGRRSSAKNPKSLRRSGQGRGKTWVA